MNDVSTIAPTGIFQSVLSGLAAQPRASVTGRSDVPGYSARVVIPDYDEYFARYYHHEPNGCLKPAEFRHFGVIVDFDEPVELKVHDAARCLDENLRALLSRFGPILMRNVMLPAPDRLSGQRNIFPDLKFHIDRARTQEEQISMFWRDPRDPVQCAPRTSSTLVLPNQAAYLQALAEGYGEHEFKQSYQLFGKTELEALIGKILLELKWNAGHGVGEVSLLDNRTVMHASYYPLASNKGYPISVRYLS